MILALALVAATLQPASPTVGDLITVTFPAPVVLDASREYEVVARSGNSVVVRTFQPKPFAMNGTTGGQRFTRTIPVTSVLKQGDDLKPAPLAPPVAIAYPRLPWYAIGAAALLAAIAWLVAWWRARRPAEVVAPPVHPADRLRAAVQTLLSNPSYEWRWAALANETRAFLDATRPGLTGDLTTSELVPRLGDAERVVEEILRQGDLQKFSRRGAADRDFAALATAVLNVAMGAGPSPEEGRAEARSAL
jgi:hypothetical protein